MSKIRERFM